MAAPIATAGAAAPAHQYASRFLRAARPIVRPGAMERARAARGPVAPRAQREWVQPGAQMNMIAGLRPTRTFLAVRSSRTAPGCCADSSENAELAL